MMSSDVYLVPKTNAPVSYCGFCIVVLTAGFIHAGYTVISGNYGFILNPVNVRRYGTEKGLSQLCYEGPLANTALDPGHELLSFPIASLVFTLDCSENTIPKWPNYLPEHDVVVRLDKLTRSLQDKRQKAVSKSARSQRQTSETLAHQEP